MGCVVTEGLEIHFSTLTSHQNHQIMLGHLAINLEKRKKEGPEACQTMNIYN